MLINMETENKRIEDVIASVLIEVNFQQELNKIQKEEMKVGKKHRQPKPFLKLDVALFSQREKEEQRKQREEQRKQREEERERKKMEKLRKDERKVRRRKSFILSWSSFSK